MRSKTTSRSHCFLMCLWVPLASPPFISSELEWISVLCYEKGPSAGRPPGTVCWARCWRAETWLVLQPGAGVSASPWAQTSPRATVGT